MSASVLEATKQNSQLEDGAGVGITCCVLQCSESRKKNNSRVVESKQLELMCED